jgi:parallel beta-helix repeat protein
MKYLLLRSKDKPMKKLEIIGAVLLVAGVLAYRPNTMRGANGSHAPIVIANDSDFTVCNCMTSGSGTTTDPYIIGPWVINSASGNAAVVIDGALLTKSFTLSNLMIAGDGTSSSAGIVLNHINPSGQNTISAAVSGTNTSIQHTGIGIVVENSNFVTLDGGGANPNGPGIVTTNTAGTINKNFVGAIDIENSSNITVKGWQFSANGQDNSPDYIAFDPSLANWGVGAVRLFASNNNLIDHNAANNCTTASFTVLDSSHNTISNNTADYPFTNNVLITDGSSFNSVMNNVFGTADFVGILVADPLPGTMTLNQFGPSHDNLIQGNVDHSDGGTGTERHSGIAPAFDGGIVILNGTYNNNIKDNQVSASAGADLVWAQEVIDPSTPIGIAAEPPFIHCNVTVSEGGVGVVNQNGNVWSGNTFKKIDPCITQH